MTTPDVCGDCGHARKDHRGALYECRRYLLEGAFGFSPCGHRPCGCRAYVERKSLPASVVEAAALHAAYSAGGCSEVWPGGERRT